MAAALLIAACTEAMDAQPDLIPPLVLSAGTGAMAGHSASPLAIEAMHARGLDLSDHSTRPLDADLLLGADLVLCMTSSHRAVVRESLAALELPAPPDVELIDPQGRDVDDPFGGSTPIYERCAVSLDAMIRSRVSDWRREFA
jgi:protein-tyrosine phosphatase